MLVVGKKSIQDKAIVRASYVTGRWYTGLPYDSPGDATEATLTEDKIFAAPFLCMERATWDRFGISVHTADASTFCKVGIYANCGAYPASLILGSGAISLAGTGEQTDTISLDIDAGEYWIMVLGNGVTAKLECVEAAGSRILGDSSVVSAPALSINDTTGSYAAGLPDPFPAGASYGAPGVRFRVCLRKA